MRLEGRRWKTICPGAAVAALKRWGRAVLVVAFLIVGSVGHISVMTTSAWAMTIEATKEPRTSAYCDQRAPCMPPVRSGSEWPSTCDATVAGCAVPSACRRQCHWMVGVSPIAIRGPLHSFRPLWRSGSFGTAVCAMSYVAQLAGLASSGPRGWSRVNGNLSSFGARRPNLRGRVAFSPKEADTLLNPRASNSPQ